MFRGFPDGSVVKNLPVNAGDSGLIPGSGRSPGGGNINPLQYSCLKNPMARGAWQAIVHGVTKDWATEHPHRYVHTHTHTSAHVSGEICTSSVHCIRANFLPVLELGKMLPKWVKGRDIEFLCIASGQCMESTIISKLKLFLLTVQLPLEENIPR